MGKDRAAVNEVFRNLISSITVMTLIIVALTVILGLFVARSVVNPINRVIEGLTDGADQVVSASTQISTASQSLAQGASEHASSIEETSSSLEEISSMTKQNATHAEQAKGLMAEVDSLVSKGRESMDRMNGAIQEIKKSSDATSKIIKTIDEIAFQTNLLALNALQFNQSYSFQFLLPEQSHSQVLQQERTHALKIRPGDEHNVES